MNKIVSIFFTSLVTAVLTQELDKSFFEDCGMRHEVKNGDELRLNFMKGGTGDIVQVSNCSVTFFAKDGDKLSYSIGKPWELYKDDLKNGSTLLVLSSTEKDAKTTDWSQATKWTHSEQSITSKGGDILQLRIKFLTPLTTMPFMNLFFTIYGEKGSSNLAIIIGATVGGIVALVLLGVLIYCFCCRKKY